MNPPFETAENLAQLSIITHGFFGRDAGDMSETLGTPSDEVAANRRAAMAAIGMPEDSLASLKQTHSNRVIEITADSDLAARPDADGMVTKLPVITLGILTADCIPAVFADPEAGIIGACHAGWKGAVTGIASHTVDAMVRLGAKPERIRAAIGPAISGVNYEVGPDFARNLDDYDITAKSFIFLPEGKTREHFDLPAFLGTQLQLAGLTNIAFAGGCTFAEPARYFSHRQTTQNGAPAGRQIALIGLR